MSNKESRKQAKTKRVLPLVSTAFTPGTCHEVIEKIADPDEREMARAEHCLFTGKAQEAAVKAKPYLTHADPALCLSACVVYCIASVALEDVNEAQKTLAMLDGLKLAEDAPITSAFCADVIRVLFHLPEKNERNLDEIPQSLSEGCRFFLGYVMALREYLRGEYGKAVGIAGAIQAMEGKRYPITGVYLHVISAICLMRMDRIAEAEEQFLAAWELARPDGLISPFGESYALLAGLNRKLIKPEFDSIYKKISAYADRYFSTWIDIHNRHAEQKVSPGLTKRESTVAILFSRRWSVEKIAKHLNVSKNTVKQHLSVIYQKLGVNKREQLSEHLLI